jgi:hypothetical protein
MELERIETMRQERDEIKEISRALMEAHADACGDLHPNMTPKVQAVWDEVAKQAIYAIVGDHDFDGRFGEPLDFIVKMSKQWKKPLLAPLFKSLAEHAMFKERFEHAHEVKLANERHERCVVLWNAARYLLGAAETPRDSDAEIFRIARIALDGGPLGHQGEIVDGVDRLSLDDLERASGAISRPQPDPRVMAVELKACAACGNRPEPEFKYNIPGKRHSAVFRCLECGIHGPRCDGPKESIAERRAMDGWNAVVDAWDSGFKTSRSTDA